MQNHSSKKTSMPHRDAAVPRIPVFVGLLLILIPLAESVNGSVLWGMNYHSPKLMSQVGDMVAWVKLIAVCAGVYLIFKQKGALKLLFKNKWVSNILNIFIAVVAFIQVNLGFFDVAMDMVLTDNTDYFHKEFEIGKNTIYVHTLDQGALGKAYHNFYLKCPLPLHRFELKPIEQTDWVLDLQLKVTDVGFGVFNGRGEFKHDIGLNGINCT